uniref:Uncharacterized protein n=1 Tax=Anguilla anguilla TaxID=7936 RepID=A0A0E9QN96_ANGAN
MHLDCLILFPDIKEYVILIYRLKYGIFHLTASLSEFNISLFYG